MNVRVEYMSQLRSAVGQTREAIELPNGSCVLELLADLASRHPDAKPHLVTSSGEARPSLIVVINNTTVPARDAATTPLSSGDVVLLLPPIAGG